MKIAVISDIHGFSCWRTITGKAGKYDKIIFLGDYFDSWENKWPQQMDNFLKIIDFKKEHPEKIDLCLGNHDTSYILKEMCSGYQHIHSMEIMQKLTENSELFNIVYCYGNWIFSHAGVSKEWLEQAGIEKPEEINGFFEIKSDYFRWVGPNRYGDNPNEGPLWIRPNSLLANAVEGYNQAVGHTEQEEEPDIVKSKNIYVFTDTRAHNYATVINTENNDIHFEKLE
jgi:predicted phosphodiesterase